MHWNTQAGNITNNIKVKIDFTLPALSPTNVVTWKCNVDESARGRYNIILGQDILSELGLNLKFSEHFIESDDGPFNGSTTPMIDLGTYIFRYLNTGQIKPEGSFTNAHVKESYESDHVFTATKRSRVMLYDKYKKADYIRLWKTSVNI